MMIMSIEHFVVVLSGATARVGLVSEGGVCAGVMHNIVYNARWRTIERASHDIFFQPCHKSA